MSFSTSISASIGKSISIFRPSKPNISGSEYAADDDKLYDLMVELEMSHKLAV